MGQSQNPFEIDHFTWGSLSLQQEGKGPLSRSTISSVNTFVIQPDHPLSIKILNFFLSFF